MGYFHNLTKNNSIGGDEFNKTASRACTSTTSMNKYRNRETTVYINNNRDDGITTTWKVVS